MNMKSQLIRGRFNIISLLVVLLISVSIESSARTLRILFIEMNGRTNDNNGLSSNLNASIAKELRNIIEESCFIYISDGTEPFHTVNYEEFNDVFVALKEQKTLKAKLVNDKKLFWKHLFEDFGTQSFDNIEMYFYSSGTYNEELMASKPSYWLNHLVKELSVLFGVSEASINYYLFFDSPNDTEVKEKYQKRWNFGTEGSVQNTFSDNIHLINTAEQ
jgi:hypothetical protein